MGRPSNYDMDQVLRGAAGLFRARAYRSVSVQDIVDATGINRFAIYEKFGGKEELFYAALEYYLDVPVKQELLRPFREDSASFEEVMNVLGFMRNANRDTTQPPGCVITNAIIEFSGENERVEAVGRGFCRALQEAFEGALSRAECLGQVRRGRPARARAEYLVTMVNAFMVLGTVSRSEAEKLVSAVIDEVASWRQEPAATDKSAWSQNKAPAHPHDHNPSPTII